MATTARIQATETTAAAATPAMLSAGGAERATGRRAGVPQLPLRRPRSGAGFAAVVGLGCLLALSACSESNPFTVTGLPESPDVETAAWPSLSTAPAPRSQTGATGVVATVAKGDEIRTDIDSEAAQLRAEVAKLEARPVITGSLSAEAARLRAQARALAARP
jgi:hypothetical protein